jgi:hypothetical protein
MQLPLVFDALVPHQQFAIASEDVRRVRFGFGAVSTNPRLPIWRGEIDKSSRAVALALNALRKATGSSFDLVACHMNLQTHGLDGAFHTDDGDPDGAVTHALNWYVHPYAWPVEWGGYLLVGDDPRNLRAILPARNSAVLIASATLHCAVSPFANAGPMARISLTLKLRLEDAL